MINSCYCDKCGQIIAIKKRDLTKGSAKKLISIMEKHSLSQTQICELMGVTKQTLYRWLRNETSPKNLNWDALRLKGIK